MKMCVRIHDNGAGYCICVNGLIVLVCDSLGNAWHHIEWMYRVAKQDFTVGKNQVPVVVWIEGMKKAGYLD